MHWKTSRGLTFQLVRGVKSPGSRAPDYRAPQTGGRLRVRAAARTPIWFVFARSFCDVRARFSFAYFEKRFRPIWKLAVKSAAQQISAAALEASA